MSEIKSESITLVDIDSIIPNPKNANIHSIEQIKRLEKLITYQGFRNPLIVSNRTGFLIVGHGRLEAAINLGLEKLPVIYQDFKDEAQEYSYLISDNEIARWSELDKQAIFDLKDEIQFDDMEMLGLEFDFISCSDLDLETALADAGIEMGDDEIKDGVKKAIQIEFNLEHFEEAKELIGWWRKEGAYIGEMMISYLRAERDNHEASRVS